MRELAMRGGPLSDERAARPPRRTARATSTPCCGSCPRSCRRTATRAATSDELCCAADTWRRRRSSRTTASPSTCLLLDRLQRPLGRHQASPGPGDRRRLRRLRRPAVRRRSLRGLPGAARHSTGRASRVRRPGARRRHLPAAGARPSRDRAAARAAARHGPAAAQRPGRGPGRPQPDDAVGLPRQDRPQSTVEHQVHLRPVGVAARADQAGRRPRHRLRRLVGPGDRHRWRPVGRCAAVGGLCQRRSLHRLRQAGRPGAGRCDEDEPSARARGSARSSFWASATACRRTAWRCSPACTIDEARKLLRLHREAYRGVLGVGGGQRQPRHAGHAAAHDLRLADSASHCGKQSIRARS